MTGHMLWDSLNESVSDAGDVAVVCGEKSLTYAQLFSAVTSHSRALLGAGVRKGDRVALISPPSADFLVFLLAIARIGAIYVGINPRAATSEVAHVLDDSAPVLLVRATSGERIRPSEPVAEPPVLELTDPKQRQHFLGRGRAVSPAALRAAEAAVKPEDPALIIYTSGSTGRPKGALISHYGLVVGARLQNGHFDVHRPSIICNLPINHVGSVADICCTTLLAAGTIVFQPRFDPEAMLQALVSRRISIWAGVPTTIQSVMDLPQFERADLRAVELILWGGAALTHSYIERLALRGFRMLAAYGMTETSCHVTFTGRHAPVASLATTVGSFDPSVEHRLVGPGDERVPAGSAGELHVRSPTNFLGYFRNEAANAAAFAPGGWLRTGDIAVERDDGSILLVGRRHDMFKSGGENVYPREVELALESHPGVSAAAVVSIPDSRYQEVGVGFITRRNLASVDAHEVREFLRGQLVNFKIPKRVHILQAFPMLPIGKVDKHALRELAQTMEPPSPPLGAQTHGP